VKRVCAISNVTPEEFRGGDNTQATGVHTRRFGGFLSPERSHTVINTPLNLRDKVETAIRSVRDHWPAGNGGAANPIILPPTRKR
jgi:hypothetical protein